MSNRIIGVGAICIAFVATVSVANAQTITHGGPKGVLRGDSQVSSPGQTNPFISAPSSGFYILLRACTDHTACLIKDGGGNIIVSKGRNFANEDDSFRESNSRCVDLRPGLPISSFPVSCENQGGAGAGDCNCLATGVLSKR